MKSETAITEILLVEDNPVNCEIALDMLETMGLNADVADNGIQALKLYQSRRYKLILMDCEMPVMDGFTAARHIREIEKGLPLHAAEPVKVPIIALTAHATSTVKQQCISCGMDDFLSKPFSLEELNAIFLKWLATETGDESLSQQTDTGAQMSVAAEDEREDDLKGDWSVLSQEILSRYYQKQKKNGSNLLSKIIEIYLAQSNGLIDDLKQAVENNDIESARIISHTLKSSSMNVGASALADSCRTVELACSEGRIEDAALLQVYQGYSKAKKALKDILDDMSSQ